MIIGGKNKIREAGRRDRRVVNPNLKGFKKWITLYKKSQTLC